MMMTPKQIRTAVSSISNQMKAGIPLTAAVKRMAKLQKMHDRFWLGASHKMAQGSKFSDCLDEVWPDAFMSAVRAGEESGSLPEVFDEIDKSIEVQMKIRGMVFKLAYPVGLGLVGVCVFIFFMLVVFPALTKALGEGNKSFVFQLSEWMVKVANAYWMYILMGVALFISYIVIWIRDPENRDAFIDFLITMPIIGEAMTNLFFSSWASYMSLMDKAGGIDIQKRLQLSANVLPGKRLKRGVMLLRSEVISRGMSDACDPEKQAPGDPRRDWPFYISNAFMVTAETGELDKELSKVAASLLKDGLDKMDFTIKVGNVIAMCVSAILVVGPLLAYYVELGSKLQSAMAGGH